LQNSKAPWEHVTEVLKRLENKEIRSNFIKELEALHHKHKHASGFKELCLRLADLVVDNANML
jgi:hypothetical protein